MVPRALQRRYRDEGKWFGVWVETEGGRHREGGIAVG